MSTDTQNLVYLGNVVKNLPTTTAALESPDLAAGRSSRRSSTSTNPDSTYMHDARRERGRDIFQKFLDQWQTGQTTTYGP
jgi:hypothetical protein